jgi:hypothetical protein
VLLLVAVGGLAVLLLLLIARLARTPEDGAEA